MDITGLDVEINFHCVVPIHYANLRIGIKKLRKMVNKLTKNKKWVVIDLPETEDRGYYYAVILASNILYMDVYSHTDEEEEE